MSPNLIIGLSDISLICTKFGPFTIIGTIVPKLCTYPPDYSNNMRLKQPLPSTNIPGNIVKL